MKTIDTKSLLLGVLATALFLTLTSGKTNESDTNFQFFTTASAVGIYNNTTKTIYTYGINGMGKGLDESPSRIFKIADDGSSLTRK
jgi:hypothetical protein